MTSQILRVSIRGALPGGEVWSVNPCWEVNGQVGDIVTAGQAQTLATAIANVAYPTALTQAMSAGTTVSSIRVEGRRLDGALEVQAEAALLGLTNGTGAQAHPYQTAIVLSLRTPGVGASSRGRMYWPATAQSLDATTLRLTTSNANSLLTGFKTFLSGVETAIHVTLPEANLTVWSRSTQNFHNVNGLQLGNILDTQRRRRDRLIEGYVGVSFP